MDNTKQVKTILWQILILNWLVAAAKITVGLLFNVISLTADGFHSVLDGNSNIVGLIALSISGKPADKNHPYGHKKFETFASTVIGIMILIAAFTIAKSTYERITTSSLPETTPFTFITIISTLLINLGVTTYESKRGKELGSDILIADAKHTQSDVFASSVVLVSLIGIGFGLNWIDLVGSAVIIILIAKAGFGIIKDGVMILSDAVQMDPDLILKTTMEISEVRFCHKIRSRGSAEEILVDLHIGVDPEITIRQAHKITHTVIDKLKTTYPKIKDVIVHTEPCEKNQQ
ncbi:MAG: cation diffusion facilitator family transporter [bacterium]